MMFTANNPAELAAELAALDIDVPPRSEGRQSHHVERYCIAHLLATLPAERISFPLTLAHRDKPDFLLTMSGIAIGIEHTEAVPTSVARSQAMREQGLGADVYFTPHAKPGEQRKTAKEIRDEIEADVPGEGWVGDAPEREWAEAIAHYVRDKLPKAMDVGFERYAFNWLIVYDNWPLPAVKYSVAASYLAPLLVDMSAFSVFDAIFIHDESFMCQLSEKGEVVRGLIRPALSLSG
jgi:hypothetical protein